MDELGCQGSAESRSRFCTRAWNLVMPVLTVGLAGMGVILGCGNFTSVYFPQYVRQMQRGVLSLVMLLLAALLLIPVFFHQVVTRLVAPRILERAPEILAVVTREEG